MGLPIPFLFFADMPDGRLEVVDGNQRLNTCKVFLDNELDSDARRGVIRSEIRSDDIRGGQSANLCGQAAHGEVLVLQPGLADGKDAAILGQNPNGNYGDWGEVSWGSYIYVDSMRLVAEFDLGGLPADARIESATLTMTSGSPYHATHEYRAHLFNLTEDWDESTVTYNSWSVPGGAYDTEWAATDFAMPGASPSVPVMFDVTALVSAWTDGTLPNHGFILIPETLYIAPGGSPTNNYSSWFYSDHLADPTRRPKLVIEYSLEPQGCTYTQGYWKNHGSWPIDRDTDLCGMTWSENLSTPPRGDAFYILSHQFIAASLNVASGASTPIEVSEGLDQAAALLAVCSIGGHDRAAAIGLAGLLDEYNNGLIGPGHCGDDSESNRGVASAVGSQGCTAAPMSGAPVTCLLLVALGWLPRRRRPAPR